jgi:hypothetical protein
VKVGTSGKVDKHAIKYFWQVLRRFKAQLGGASALVVLAGIVEHYIQASVHWNVYAWIIAACLFVALFVEGLDSYTKLLPILKISQNVLPQEWAAPGGTRCRAYYLEVFNPSAARTIQHVSVQLVSIEPDVQNLKLAASQPSFEA